MTRSFRMAVAVALPAFALFASAAPVPKRVINPISATNAADVISLAEIEKQPFQIVRGPGKNELTILDWESNVEVVDDVKLSTLRTFTKDRAPINFAMSPDGKFVTWTGRSSTSYTVLETTSGKSFVIEIGKYPGGAAFSPDGKLLAIGNTVWNQMVQAASYSEMMIFDVTGKHTHRSRSGLRATNLFTAGSGRASRSSDCSQA